MERDFPKKGSELSFNFSGEAQPNMKAVLEDLLALGEHLEKIHEQGAGFYASL